MKKLVLIGAGGHCRSCIDVIESTNMYKISHLIDIKDKIGTKVLGNYVIDKTDENINELVQQGYYFLITIGHIKTCEPRVKVFNLLTKLGANLATVVSPLAYVSKYAKIGKGSIVMHGAIVNANASISENCIINSKALIEHDVQIKNNCHISTGSIVNGECIIEENTFFGSNSTTRECITIHQNSTIGAATVVLKNIPSKTVYFNEHK